MIDEPYRAAIVFARTELLAAYRRLRNDPEQGLAVLVAMLLFGVWLPSLIRERAISFGHELVTGQVPVGTGGELLMGLAIVVGYLGVVTGFYSSTDGNTTVLVRTAVPPAAHSLGRLLLWTIGGVILLTPTATILLWGIVDGAGTILVIPLLFVVTAPVMVAALVFGRVLGLLLKCVHRTFDVSLWVTTGVSLLAMTGTYLGFHLILESGTVGADGSASAFFPGTPLQALFGTVFAPFGGPVTTAGLVTAIVIVLAVPIGIVAAIRIERSVAVRGSGSATPSPTPIASSRTVPGAFSGTPATRTAWRYLLRTRRDPRTIGHLSTVVFIGVTMIVPFVSDPGDLAGMLPAIAVVGGPTLGGASFCLNPIGEERSQLPLLITSTPSPSVVVRGRLIAGVLFGLVVAVGIGTPAGLFFGSPVYAVIQTVFAVFLTVAGVGTALGMGANVPSFEQGTGLTEERVTPNWAVMFGFVFGGIVVGGVGLSILEWTFTAASVQSAAVVWTVYVAIVGGIAWGGYIHAVSRFDALAVKGV